jgi:hypothetical protein
MKRVLLCAALLAWSGLSAAAVYKWVDAQGKILYGDRPPDGVKAELVTLIGNHVPQPSAPRQNDSNRGARSAADAPGTPTAKDATKKSVDQDVAAAKVKLCADAQERYRKLVEGRRIYRSGKDGEREYLSADEIDSERLNAKREIDSVCNGST